MKFNLLKDNKGFSLVEIIIGVVLLAIASIMLVNGFVATANIVNRATLYKNASVASSSSIELQEVQASRDPNVSIDLSRNDGNIIVTGTKKNGTPVNFSIAGEYLVGTDQGESDLIYREFLPGSYDFNVPAVPMGG